VNNIVIIDYGMGNLRSVDKALEHVAGGQARVSISGDRDTILEADRVIFPGVGAIRDCMSELERLDLIDVVRTCAATRPFLGICLGMQAIMDRSEENGGTDCLGIMPGEVRRFALDLRDAAGGRLKVPHMGWNQVNQTREHPLWQGIEQDSWFYFVHSYYVAPQEAAETVGATDYGVDFTAAVARDKVFAIQCHPEKSQHAGLQLLTNFVSWDGAEG
jgi:glutamine amidotransferase